MKSNLSRHTFILWLFLSAPGLLTVLNAQPASSHQIAFFSAPRNTTPEGHFFDKPLMDTLRHLGYRVDHMYTSDECMSPAKLNSYNLIIIGRGSRSGDFTQTQFWSEIKTPVLCLSGYMVFPNFFNWIGSGQLQGPNGDRFDVDTSVIQYVHAVKPQDTSFYNISMDGHTMPYNTWIYDFIDYDSASFAAENNGQLLATYTGLEPSMGHGRVAMARWMPGEKTYEHGVILQGYRTYMQMGTDNDGNPPILNHLQFTSESYQVFKNEIAYLISLYEDSVSHAEKPACSDARIRQVIFNNETIRNINSSSTIVYTNIAATDLKNAGVEITTVDADASVHEIYYDSLNHYLIVKTIAGDGVTSLEYKIYPGDRNDLVNNNAPAADNHNLVFYPNPVNSYLNVQMGYAGNKEISVFSYSNQLVDRLSTGGHFVTIDTQDYVQGIYLLRISYAGNKTVKSFIKE